MRNPYFDVLKFFAIMLVVYGHVAGAFGCDFGRPWLNNFIVGMNMPIFFIISGYFAAKPIKNRDWKKLVKSIYGYFWPLSVMSVIFAALALAFHISGSENGFIGYVGRRILFSAWFLWCLAICFSITFLCAYPKLTVCKGLFFSFLIIVLPFISNVWHVANVRAMLPYFMFGVFVLHKWEIWRDRRVGLACLLVYVVGVVFQGDINSNGLNNYSMNTTWAYLVSDWKAFPLYLGRIVNGIVGSIGIMWLFQMSCARCVLIAELGRLGTTTLWVYILHQWLLGRVVDAGWGSSSIWRTLVWTGLLFVFCHFAVKGVQAVVKQSCCKNGKMCGKEEAGQRRFVRSGGLLSFKVKGG